MLSIPEAKPMMTLLNGFRAQTLGLLLRTDCMARHGECHGGFFYYSIFSLLCHILPPQDLDCKSTGRFSSGTIPVLVYPALTADGFTLNARHRRVGFFLISRDFIVDLGRSIPVQMPSLLVYSGHGHSRIC